MPSVLTARPRNPYPLLCPTLSLPPLCRVAGRGPAIGVVYWDPFLRPADVSDTDPARISQSHLTYQKPNYPAARFRWAASLSIRRMIDLGPQGGSGVRTKKITANA